MHEKHHRLAEFCARVGGGVEGVHLRRRSNIAWLTDGADTHVDLSSRLGIASLVWTTDGRRIVITDNIESPRLKSEELQDGWEFHVANWWERSASPLPAEFQHLRLATDWPDDPVGPLRASLTDLEIQRVRALGRDAARVFEAAMRTLRPGLTEHQLAARIVGPLRALNIHTPVMLIASDDRLPAFRHPIPTDKPIQRIAMAAICAQRHGLTVSITRIVSFGPISEDLAKRHTAVCRVDQTLHERTRPGERWCDVLAAAQAVYAETGFAGEWQKHHQGGPMGYELRDFVATPTETRRVVPRQLVGWNPSITGTKSEDTILVEPTPGAPNEVLTSMPDWPAGAAGRPDILVLPA